MKRRKGHQVEYQGKKYDSLSELSKDLELPYSSIVHNYYRTKNVDKAVKIAQKAKEAEIYVVWGKKNSRDERKSGLGKIIHTGIVPKG